MIIAVYVDNIAKIANTPDRIINILTDKYKFKLKSMEPIN